MNRLYIIHSYLPVVPYCIVACLCVCSGTHEYESVWLMFQSEIQIFSHKNGLGFPSSHHSVQLHLAHLHNIVGLSLLSFLASGKGSLCAQILFSIIGMNIQILRDILLILSCSLFLNNDISTVSTLWLCNRIDAAEHHIIFLQYCINFLAPLY